MSKQEWLVGIVGGLIGVVLTILVGSAYYSAHNNGQGWRGMWQMMDGSYGYSGTNGGYQMMSNGYGAQGSDSL